MSPSPLLLCLLLAAGDGEYDALVERALAAKGAGDRQQSLELLQRAYRLRPSPALRHNLGRLLEELGRYGEAAAEYRGLLADPQAPEKLRSADSERLEALRERLDHAWITLEGGAGMSCRLDGRPCPMGQEEAALEPGRRMLELSAGGALSVTVLELELGRRARVPLLIPGPGQGELRLGALAARASRVELDEQPLQTPPAGVRSLWAAPGAHLLLIYGTGKRGEEEVLFRGRLELRAAAAVDVPWAPPAPPPAPRSQPWWLLGVGGAGAAVAVGGPLYFFGSAGRSRDRVRNAERDGAGRIIGVTEAQAAELEAGAARNDRLGVVALGVGGAVLAAAAVLWLLDDPSSGEGVQRPPQASPAGESGCAPSF